MTLCRFYVMIFSRFTVYGYNLYSFLSISDRQNKWLIKNAERPLLVYAHSPISSSAHTALAPMIEIGSLEWMDMTDSYCIHQCIDFDMYSSIHINLCYVVWSAVLFSSMAKSPIW